MIKEMVIRELLDESDNAVTRAVEAECLTFWCMCDEQTVKNLTETEFFFLALEYLEEHEDLRGESAKIDSWY